MIDPSYMSGFGNEFETEAMPGALPEGRNNPQNCRYGLYAEQLSGSAFTAPNAHNWRSWLYRVRPSVKHVGKFDPQPLPDWRSAPCSDEVPLAQYRWDPLPIPLPGEAVDFLHGTHTMTAAGDVKTQLGCAVHAFAFNQSMTGDYLSCADGELLVVPQQGCLNIRTELGVLQVTPGEIAVIPRAVIFSVSLDNDEAARGFICENYGQRFVLPERGPIGANGLANARDFLTPVARFEDEALTGHLWFKWCGSFYRCAIDHSPFDVVAWHGNYAPYKYDLRRFSPVGSILYDHPDPSIFTVLTSPSEMAGVANVDFVAFTERWLVAEDTFRPPWFHRNIMSEFMANLDGIYDAKPEGFAPGGMSLHNMFLPHGPDHDAFNKASAGELKPHKLTDTLSLMFETRLAQQLTNFAISEAPVQAGYAQCWDGLKKRYDGTPDPE